MADALQIDLIANRRVPFVEEYSFLETDFTGSAFLMQVREVKDTTGTPLIAAPTVDNGLSLAYAGTATVAAHVAAGRLLGDGEDNIYEIVNPATGNPYAGTDSLTLSQVSIAISASAFTAIPTTGSVQETGDDWSGWYDIIRTPATGPTEIAMRGRFVVLAGVTIP